MNDVINGQRPPQLGNVTIARDTAETWRVLCDGTPVASDLDFATVTAVIRGAITIDELTTSYTGGKPMEEGKGA